MGYVGILKTVHRQYLQDAQMGSGAQTVGCCFGPASGSLPVLTDIKKQRVGIGLHFPLHLWERVSSLVTDVGLRLNEQLKTLLET